jgi:hypothetical protein
MCLEIFSSRKKWKDSESCICLEDIKESAVPRSERRTANSEQEDILECKERFSPEDFSPPKCPLETKPPRARPDLLVEKGKEDPSVFSQDTLRLLMETEREYEADLSRIESRHPAVSKSMIAVLWDWMMEVCMEFRLTRRTFQAAVNYASRYLSRAERVDKKNLQLVGLTAMRLASKFEEVFCPKTADFSKAAEDLYTLDDILTLENHMVLVSIFLDHT